MLRAAFDGQYRIRPLSGSGGTVYAMPFDSLPYSLSTGWFFSLPAQFFTSYAFRGR